MPATAPSSRSRSRRRQIPPVPGQRKLEEDAANEDVFLQACREAAAEAEEGKQARFKPGYMPKKVCTFFQQGRCTKGTACSFAHSAEELHPEAPFPQEELPSTFQSGPNGFVQSLSELSPARLNQVAIFRQIAGGGRDELRAAQLLQACNWDIVQGVAAAVEEDELKHAMTAQQGGNGMQFGPRKFPPGHIPEQLCEHWLYHPSACVQGDACLSAHGLAEMGYANGSVGNGKGCKGMQSATQHAAHHAPAPAFYGKPPGSPETLGVSRFHNTRFKPVKMCTFFQTRGCTKGDACSFAHDPSEMAP